MNLSQSSNVLRRVCAVSLIYINKTNIWILHQAFYVFVWLDMVLQCQYVCFVSVCFSLKTTCQSLVCGDPLMVWPSIETFATQGDSLVCNRAIWNPTWCPQFGQSAKVPRGKAGGGFTSAHKPSLSVADKEHRTRAQYLSLCDNIRGDRCHLPATALLNHLWHTALALHTDNQSVRKKTNTS